MTDANWEALSNQAVAAAGVVYFLALLALLAELAFARRVSEPAAARTTAPDTARGRRADRAPCDAGSQCSAGSGCC